MKRNHKRRNPLVKKLFDTDYPFAHKVERSKKAYKRQPKYKEDYNEPRD